MPRRNPAFEDSDYAVFVTCYGTGDGRYVGSLKIVRRADRRILFPFDGAPVIGPHGSQDEARRTAIDLAARLIAADRAMPEA